VVRKSRDGFADASWHREQRVTRDEALALLTRAPAFAAFQEKERGSIEVGKQADFTILSADLMSVPEDEILATRVMMTVIAGEVVYRR
jgi:predicted amidohydrolase YtcJ